MSEGLFVNPAIIFIVEDDIDPVKGIKYVVRPKLLGDADGNHCGVSCDYTIRYYFMS